MEKLKVGMLLFPDVTIQDFVGPYEVFVKAECFEVYTVALNNNDMKAEGGLTVKADYSFDDCPLTDILFVPGGKGITALLKNTKYTGFLQKQGKNAQYITSVCTGALLLAAAGLLTGYRATTHWRAIGLLKMFSVEAVEERVVIDRNRVTGGGITAGIDFGLLLTALIGGADRAKLVQLILEYNPQPPFQSGSPKMAEAHILSSVLQFTQSQFDTRQRIITEIIEDSKPNLLM
ncbi:MAG: DJ-1/PfpI family protein [Ferruginibacter sp.]